MVLRNKLEVENHINNKQYGIFNGSLHTKYKKKNSTYNELWFYYYCYAQKIKYKNLQVKGEVNSVNTIREIDN